MTIFNNKNLHKFIVIQATTIVHARALKRALHEYVVRQILIIVENNYICCCIINTPNNRLEEIQTIKPNCPN